MGGRTCTGVHADRAFASAWDAQGRVGGILIDDFAEQVVVGCCLQFFVGSRDVFDRVILCFALKLFMPYGRGVRWACKGVVATLASLTVPCKAPIHEIIPCRKREAPRARWHDKSANLVVFPRTEFIRRG